MKDLTFILNDKTTKAKEKTEILGRLLLEGQISVDELAAVAKKAKEALKATCIEALEYATKTKPDLLNPEALDFVSESLADKAPRVKWESAKVIGNCAHLFPGRLDKALHYLLENSEHSGAVVRWSVAYALGEVVQLETEQAKELVPAVKAIAEREEKNSIRKIYLAALKKAGK